MDHTIVFTGHEKRLTPLEFVWLQGPNKGKRLPIGQGRQTYGRDPANNIVLDCPTVSKNHGILLYQEEGKILIYDTLSKNGISVQGKKNPVITLKLGQNIQIGSAFLKLVKEGGEITPAEHYSPRLANPARWIPLGAVFLLLAGVSMGALVSLSILHPMSGRQLSPTSVEAAKPISLEIPRASRRSFKKSPIISRKNEKQENPRLENRPLQNLIKTDELEEQARTAFANGQFNQASQLWQQVLVADPSNQRAQEGLKSLQQTSALPNSPQSPPRGGV